MNILHVITSVDPRGGGPIEGLKQLARVNSANGHRVHVASLDDANDEWVITCPVECFALGPSYLKYGYAPKLQAWLRDHERDYDAVIVNGIWQYHAFAVWRVLRRSRTTPYFVFTHGMLDPYFKRRYPLKHLKKWIYWALVEHRVLRDAKAVLFTCEEERRLARQSFGLYQARELIVNYGIAEPPNSVGQQAAFLDQFPELQDKRILLSLGRLHPKKGLELAVRAFGELAKGASEGGMEAHLVLAGPEDRAYGIRLRAIAKELNIVGQVSFVGMLTGDMKWGAFRCADAFILPSYQENFGIAAVEALACGLPVLISDQVNIWREIEEDGAAFVQPATLAGTRQLILAWLGLSDRSRQLMRHAALNSYRRRFNAERAAESLIVATQSEPDATLQK